MDNFLNETKQFFLIYSKPQTYLNFLYLLFSFPLGLFYFIFLAVGFSLGLGLAILWIGLFLLVGVMAAAWGFASLERQMAVSMLKVPIAPMVAFPAASGSFWQKMKSFFTNPITWKGLLFLLLKFPIGLATFIFTTIGISIPVTFIAAPFIYRFANIQINGSMWHVDTLPESLILFFLGIPLLTLVLYGGNWLAALHGKVAQALLESKPSSSPISASSQTPPTTSESEPTLSAPSELEIEEK